MLRAAPRARRPGLARLLGRLRPLMHPFACLGVFYLVIGATHLAFVYDATLRAPGLHELEHIIYLTAGLMMWWPILDADPVPGHRLDGFGRLAYVIVAMVPMTVIGAYMDRHTGVIYSPYGAPAQAMGISAVHDQQRAGAIMWVLGSMIMVGAGLWQAMAAMIAEERRLKVAERAGLRAAVGDRGPNR
jgi:putative copper resistance protein D